MTKQAKQYSRSSGHVQQFSKFSRSALIIGLNLSLLLANMAPAQAGFIERIRAVFQPNSQLGSAPGNRRGGGTRDICQSRDEALREGTAPAAPSKAAMTNAEAIAQGLESADLEAANLEAELPVIIAFSPGVDGPNPTSGEPDILVEGKTLETHPRFGLYIPFAQAENTANLQFSIADTETYEYLIEPFTLDLPKVAGLVSIQLPEHEEHSGLQPERLYEWTVALRCGAEDSSRTLQEVSGLVSLASEASDSTVSSTTTSDSTSKPPAIRSYTDYLERGLWYDMVTQLMISRDLHPDIWLEFLAYFGLDGETIEPRLIPHLSPSYSPDSDSIDTQP